MFTFHKSNRPATNHILLGALLALLGCTVFAACTPVEDATAEAAGPETYFPISIGPKTLQLQLALTPAEHRKGLMFRKELPADHGMLFLFERPRQQSFWMKNTSIPLDIGYFDASGQLIEVHKLFPYDETGVTSRSEQILMAVETNRGCYAKNGISPGDQLDMESLKEAIAQRGFSTATYAIED